MKRIFIALSMLSVLAAGIAFAQGAHHGQGSPPMPAKPHETGQGSGHGAAATAPDTPATRAYRAANAAMHKDMDIAYSGDADVDFIKGMIPHHEGAVAMARIVLAHGKDAETRKLAEDIVKAQESEIALMKQWLARQGQ